MEEALQYKETAQFIGLPTASPRSHRYDGDKAGHALTFKPDHSMGADHWPLLPAHLGVLFLLLVKVPLRGRALVSRGAFGTQYADCQQHGQNVK
jgi:hypothetical protein